MKNLVWACPSPSFDMSFLGSGSFALVSNGGQMNPPGLFTDLLLEVDDSLYFHIGSSLSIDGLLSQCHSLSQIDSRLS